MRTLLIPQTQLAGKLRVLVNARLDLDRPIDQTGLGKIVDNRCAVVLAVAAPGNPPDQVRPVEGREGQNLNVLDAAFARQLHQYKVRLHRLRLLRATFAQTNFRRDRPLIFLVIKDLGIGHVIEAVNFGLQLEQ